MKQQIQQLVNFKEEQTFERACREDPRRGLTVADGEAGRGVYGYVAPNKKMKAYYLSGPKVTLVRFTVKGEIVDLTKELDALVAFAKEEVDKLAATMKYYQKPKINKSNVQRFLHSIAAYMRNKHPNASGYIVLHKGPGAPTGKQVVVTKPNNIVIQKIGE